ncbi:hypothetical protein IG631_02247 [Alternaria alternata]|nr:hypothetical protein IG631_02247 [Alternaria alternata]
MLRRGGLWERGFSSQSTDAQADAEGFEDTGMGIACVYGRRRGKASHGKSWRLTACCPPQCVRCSAELRQDTDRVHVATSQQGMFGKPSMADEMRTIPPPLAARL